MKDKMKNLIKQLNGQLVNILLAVIISILSGGFYLINSKIETCDLRINTLTQKVDNLMLCLLEEKIELPEHKIESKNLP